MTKFKTNTDPPGNPAIGNRKPTPPRWAERLLEWYCRPELLEDLQGDLNEYFDRHCQSLGTRTARLIYILDVLKFFRSYTIRKPEFINLLIHWLMLSSYIKTSGRNMVRNKLFSFINIAGLAISMSVGLVTIALLADMSQYDKYNTNYDRIYRVITRYQYLEQEANNFASTSLKAGKDIRESVPGMEGMAVLYRGLNSDVTAEDKTVPLSGLWANESLFTVFTFPFVSGNPTSALKNPYSLVITETSAKKLFGNADPLGKTVMLYENQEYVITGVIKDVPKFSHMRFDMLGSLSTREILQKDNPFEMSWENMWETYVYLLLPPETDLENLQRNLTRLSEENNQTIKNTKIHLSLQPLSAIALGEDLNNSIGPVMGKSDVWMIGILCLIVILSACFNYTNLSIARSLRRTREVGIRKVIGALKSHVFGQFTIEAILISLCAVVLAFVMFVLLKPFFLSLKSGFHDMLELDLSPRLIVYFVIMAVAVGAAAGFLPALFFSRMNAIQVLRNTSSFRVFKNVNFRKTLIVLQYTISLAFIAATIIGFKQYNYLLKFDLGYNTENILNIGLQGNKPELLVKALSEMPEVKEISKSQLVTSLGNYWVNQVKYNDPGDSASVNYNAIDENYIPLHGIKLIAGRNFTTQNEGSVESEVIVNEKLLKRFNIANGNPANAIDEVIKVNKKEVRIVGVIKDFYYGKAADSEVSAFFFRYAQNNAGYVNVKVTSQDWVATLSKIENAWRTIDDVHPLNAQFYDDQIERSYGSIFAMVKMIGFLAFLAICIASMGLLGMVVFTTETRLKEISIRKVLGASEFKLIYLLSKNFLLLLLIAALIALPLTYLFFEKVALAEMVNHAPVSILELMAGLAAVLAIAFLMIGSQTLKAARTNPAEVLKGE